MLVFKSIVGLVLGEELVGVRVSFGVRQYDISVEALELGGVKGFKPQKGLKLKAHGDLLLTTKEIASGERVEDKSGDELFVKSFVIYTRYIPRIIEGTNAEGLSVDDAAMLTDLNDLRGKQVFTKNFGDGEIELVLKKADGSGLEVMFHSNADGQVTLDALEFLQDVEPDVS